MNIKILSLFVFSFFVFSFTPTVFAENVEVVGRVDSPTTNTSGSKVVFKDSSSQEVTTTTTVDPSGIYAVSVPQGEYDITVVPPEGSPLKEVSKQNQKIDSNSESNFALPSSANSLNSLTQNIPMNILYVILGGIIVVILIVIGFVAARRK